MSFPDDIHLFMLSQTMVKIIWEPIDPVTVFK